METILQNLAETNIFNFLILVLIFIFLIKLKVINVKEITDNIQKKASSIIEDANDQKYYAANELKKTKKISNTTDNEVIKKIDLAKQNGETFAEEIIKNTESQITRIMENVSRVAEVEEKNLSLELTQSTMDKSIELAKTTIIQKLKSDNNLHDKLIENSIKELDKIKI